MSQADPFRALTGNAAAASPPRSISDAFRTVAAEHADGVALRDRDRSVTYAEIDLASNRVANRLLELGDERPLVMVAPLSLESVELLMGGLKAGRLVVPLDPRWPVEQWLEVTRRTDGLLVLPDAASRAGLPAPASERALIAADLVGDDATDPHLAVDPHAPAFVFFTSGSTGAPKGTIAGHAMAGRALDMFEVTADNNVALLAPLSFISGSITVAGLLLTGACGHFFDAMNEDFSTLPAWLDERGITILGLTATVIDLIARAVLADHRTLDAMRFVAFGGEAATVQHFMTAQAAFPNSVLSHTYGMTETGPIAGYSFESTDLPPDALVPVGHPWPWGQVDIMDDSGERVPDGEGGEIWVTGHHVAFGYWDEPALTAERFIFHSDGSRTVRTGDLGRVRPDGMLEVSGRADRRIKVHGQLVDLSEVEREVEALPDVRSAVVSSVPTDDGGHRVVAHVILDGHRSVTVGELRRGLAGRLAPYAIPRAFFRVDEVPMTVGGKVDRVRLRESAVGALPRETDYVAPRNEQEAVVARIFGSVLALDDVGIHDDFFELGGDSLSVVELLAGLSEDLDLDLSANELLRDATAQAVAARLRTGSSPARRTLVRINDGAGRPLFCVPGAADTPVQYRPLGRRLPDLAVYAFAYRGLDHRAVPDQTVTSIARRNIRAMREVDPVGPYRLLGFSFGGMVALEMTRMLQAAGDEVELLAVLEPSLGFAGTARVEQSRAFVGRVQSRSVRAHPGQDLAARLARARDLARAGVAYGSRQLHLASAGILPRHGLAQHEVFFELQLRLIRAHTSSPYRGRTVVFASPRFLEDAAEVLDAVLPPESAGGHRRDVPVAGEHLDLVREPNIAEVARVLDLHLSGDGALH